MLSGSRLQREAAGGQAPAMSLCRAAAKKPHFKSADPLFSFHKLSSVQQHTLFNMKLQLLLSLLGLLAVTASGIATQKAVIVSYPNDTPDSVVNQAMDTVREAVGLQNNWS